MKGGRNIERAPIGSVLDPEPIGRAGIESTTAFSLVFLHNQTSREYLGIGKQSRFVLTQEAIDANQSN